ncbi:hypothetical protein [Streptomyces anulatus]|uniref:hypothetical protein n=1 Tax=Streptomyces anulatus TaxID=1892 RepID=UPI00342FE906
MYEILVAARTSHSVNYGELVIGAFIALFGSLLAFNIKGCAEVVADFLGRMVSAFHHNDLVLRIPAGFFAVAGIILVLVNLKIAFFGF